MQDQNKKTESTYKIKQSKTRFVYLGVLEFFDGVFNFFSLRTTKRFWGTIYDSVTKQPLDPVIVKLYYIDGREVQTCITDLDGRYGFLARPGKFKILARKTNYLFPSKYVAGSDDGIYENLYHGEFFELAGESEVLAPNIPMDPVSLDWNQAAKKSLVSAHPFGQLLFKRVVAILFWFVLIISLIDLWAAYPGITYSTALLPAVFLILIILSWILPQPRLWGRLVLDNKFINLNLEGLLLEFHSVRFPGINFGKATVRSDGKFLLRANPGKYVLTISQVNEKEKSQVLLGQIEVRVGNLGVLNGTIKIK